MAFGFQNEAKIEAKTLKIRCWKTTHFWRRFFAEFSPCWHPKMAPKSSCFRISTGNTDFAKIVVFLKENCYFSRFRASKSRTKIDAKTHSKMTSKKRGSNVDFGVDFGLQNPSKSLRKAKRNEAICTTLWKSPQSRRKPTGVIAFGPPIWLRIWLGLLYWSAPPRPNHQSKVCNLTCSSHISAHWTREPKNIVQRH